MKCEGASGDDDAPGPLIIRLDLWAALKAEQCGHQRAVFFRILKSHQAGWRFEDSCHWRMWICRFHGWCVPGSNAGGPTPSWESTISFDREASSIVLNCGVADIRCARDLRCASDLETWPDVDVVIDAAANPSVLAGIDGVTSSRQLVEHNLLGTINVLEYCRRRRAAFILLSTSRVYSIQPLAALPVRVVGDAFVPDEGRELPPGVTAAGVSERFATSAPISLYGATKLASEQLALEYGLTYDFPVWINRCGLLAGAGQFGRPDQGILSYWINAWRHRRPLAYLGFEGCGSRCGLPPSRRSGASSRTSDRVRRSGHAVCPIDRERQRRRRVGDLPPTSERLVSRPPR